ncbi:MAG TPA: hypothetical protein VFK35_03425 [Candidatus Limnocylindrales bacterium]|nr:hypothetical protein [Candidatus Limnocylindrales bacterium]
MTAPSASHVAPVAPAGERDIDLVLAGTHLRLGSLSLARAELETIAGHGTLDDDGIRDLAEARWRTGDIAGAGEAAAAWLEGHPDDILGLVIAAEAQAALGRPGEARRLAGRAMERADGSLDPIFAGMQRSSIWPVDPGAGSGPVGVLFDDLHPGPLAPAAPAHAAAGDAEPTHDPFDPGVPAAISGGPSLWGDDAAGAAAVEDALDPTTLFHRGRVALEAGQAPEAATGLLLALRASPGLAPAVLDLLAGRSEPILVLVRGDAQRIVGRELEAMRDHAAAAGGIADPAETAPARPTDPTDPTDRTDPLDPTERSEQETS